jgi:hypothetical protein
VGSGTLEPSLTSVRVGAGTGRLRGCQRSGQQSESSLTWSRLRRPRGAAHEECDSRRLAAMVVYHALGAECLRRHPRKVIQADATISAAPSASSEANRGW